MDKKEKIDLEKKSKEKYKKVDKAINKLDEALALLTNI